MKRVLFCMALALSSVSGLADSLVQIAPGSSIVVSVYDGATTVQCSGAPAVPTRPTQYLCTARCVSGNNSYYDTDVQEYVYDRTRGVNEKLLKVCLAALPNAIQQAGATIKNVKCSVAQ